MTTPTRREYLALCGTAVALPGCAALGGPASLHQVEFNSNSDRDHTVEVRVTGDSDDLLFETEFQLEAQMANEGLEHFDGTPERLTLTIDDAPAISVDWPTRVVEMRSGERPEFVRQGCGASGDTETGMYMTVESPTHCYIEPTCGNPR